MKPLKQNSRLWFGVLLTLAFLNAEDADKRIKRDAAQIKQALQSLAEKHQI